MRKTVLKVIIGGLGVLGIIFLLTRPKPHEKTRIGVLVPVEHPALKKIVSGFESTITQSLGDRVSIEIKNAQGDAHLQAVLLQSFLDPPVDLLVTVTTQPTQMALQKADQKQPVLFLAARMDRLPLSLQKDRKLAGILDEIDLSMHLRLLKTVLPNLHKLTVVYSISDKILPEVEHLSSLLSRDHILLQKLGVQTVADLYQIKDSIEGDTDAILVLKDVVVTSGIEPLIKQAESLHKPLIVSDEASVSVGACFGLGVKEEDIGKQGAGVALRMLPQDGQVSTPDGPLIENVANIQVFMNQSACIRQGLVPTQVTQAVEHEHVPVQFLPESN